MSFSSTVIRKNYETILNEVEQAAAKCGRSPSDVQLVVVTKAQPVEVVWAAAEAGAKIFGENYPEESLEKIEALREVPGVQWHMIGHLQSRKAKLVVEHFDMLHSLDSVSLAEKLNRLLVEANCKLPVLLEFNVGGEESKTGWNVQDPSHWAEFLPVVDQLRRLSKLELQGLMTMPPQFDNPEEVRPFFARLRMLKEYINQQFPDLNLHHLSMGTSGDFRVAIEEGSTFVRIGTAIVGPRPPKNIVK